MRAARLTIIALSLGLVACSGGEKAPEEKAPESLVVLSHDSFDFPDELLSEFKEKTGVEVKIQQVGDGGELANRLVLTKDAPLGDVVYGLDNTVSYRLAGQKIIGETSVASPNKDLDFAGEPGLIPIDQGDVCINADKKWFSENNVEIPKTFEDLLKPEYSDKLVAMNPASSTPGMAFMLATIEHFGEDGWVDYWKKLKANGLKVTNGWSDAFSVDYSAGEGKGPFPMMVSYGSSPAYSVNEEKTESSTVALSETCYRQVEYAGVIAGTKNEKAASSFIEFLLTPKVQEAISKVTYMHPTNPEAKAPEDLTKFGPLADTVTTVPAEKIAQNAETWLRTWQSDVIG
ncbi:ABC transporter substrate-binding protein [Bowdeniella nasicola]|uniref:ABC transporter substrate-binding protein n=1 Tax=Bowdeniella nasicola TaxID=208480 RepID=A0A1Q5Q1C8_9ACTO|nr:thiamine ABC transporter substrate-binding protein [Bowdeniella nasicola]OKL53556.1 ABC transporter substrate-binding protein [Bowdeniella nasicola]